ncbi:MAG: hypothetical protein GY820_17230 [Gammaproteobacteria bacterium]|nr:hypothetical protein [Gammaproteobacteria bacterium]
MKITATRTCYHNTGGFGVTRLKKDKGYDFPEGVARGMVKSGNAIIVGDELVPKSSEVDVADIENKNSHSAIKKGGWWTVVLGGSREEHKVRGKTEDEAIENALEEAQGE